jgi:hypothetical protein
MVYCSGDCRQVTSRSPFTLSAVEGRTESVETEGRRYYLIGFDLLPVCIFTRLLFALVNLDTKSL